MEGVLNQNQTEKVIVNQSRVNLVNRNIMSVNGVTKVLSATPSSVVLILGTDQMQADGDGLNVTKLDVESKIVELSGTINTIKFNKSSKGNGDKNFFKRIFS